ncbi:copper homeostasis protein CutC [Neorhizobium galegae]|uniref:copper homeostasis protein CutC n=1 Tax=Neorhizobium galegae TaxID=399 RepID=UPI0012879DE7|nr:copper homeostasis protein CutC [Neorhizobium galegae]KAA9387552.1 copper homeostasis protein CutC [Neorhizobium galegae]MCM2499197.1 copper homeostasis protein CutC [Neorhizobium galegae]MCQ1772695.1 copper homeostasis protein CutC [Neorhizobium galegae]
MSILLEVCVDSPEGLAAAIAGGANRIELCAALDVGGLTPPPGMIALAARAPIPVYAIIRPRAASFVYDADNEVAMMADIDAVRAAGLAGIVIGASRPDMTLDMPLLKRLMAHARGLGVTLHRAFDLVPDPFEALEQAVELGVERILTSGLKVSGPDGIDMLKMLVERAGDRVSIMPGGGINLATVERVVRETGVHEVHSSCRRPVESTDERAIAFGFQAPISHETSSEIVRKMRGLLDELGAGRG